jgi:hypothetical protein
LDARSAEKYCLRVRCVHEAAKLTGPLQRLVVDVGDVVEAAVADYLETVCLISALPLNVTSGLWGVPSATRYTRRA